MKQKVVIKLSVHDEKCRSKAMKTAVGVDGVNSATLQQDKDQIEVTGEDVDVVRLTTLLRKSLRYAEVVSVNPVEEKKEKKEEKEEKKDSGNKIEPIIHYSNIGWPHQHQVHEIGTVCSPYHNFHYQEEPSCSIM